MVEVRAEGVGRLVEVALVDGYGRGRRDDDGETARAAVLLLSKQNVSDDTRHMLRTDSGRETRGRARQEAVASVSERAGAGRRSQRAGPGGRRSGRGGRPVSAARRPSGSRTTPSWWSTTGAVTVTCDVSSR